MTNEWQIRRLTTFIKKICCDEIYGVIQYFKTLFGSREKLERTQTKHKENQQIFKKKTAKYKQTYIHMYISLSNTNVYMYTCIKYAS